MPTTHLALHYHIIFSTKARRRMIADPWKPELHAYLGGIANDVSATAKAIGGTGDHVHLLLELKATHKLADVVRDIKKGSSAWIHHHGVQQFDWQDGYGAFTVSPSHIARVTQYILNQDEHHRKRTFEEEYEELLRLSGVSFDKRYLW